jgi:hypothetical protein
MGGSIAGLLIATEAMIAETSKKETPIPANAAWWWHGLLIVDHSTND